MNSNLGALRFTVETSSQQIEAGKEFSIYVKVTNPYSIPVSINNVSTKLPIEFVNVTAERKQKEKKELESKIKEQIREKITKKVPEIEGLKKERKEKIAEVLKDVVRAIPFGSVLSASYSLAQLASASNLRPTEKSANQLEEIASSEEIRKVAEKIDTSINPSEELKTATLDFLHNKLSDFEKNTGVVLEPGDSLVKVFNLKTRKSILFTPSSHQLHIQVEYCVNDKHHHDTIDCKFRVKSSFFSILAGSVIGSFIGFMLKDIFEEKSIIKFIQNPSAITSLEIFFKLLGNSLIGIVAVIAFARKKDVQPFVTIEDFWGGLFVGVVSGYLGKSFLDNSIIPADLGNAGK
jgi:hypothetical protein